MTSIPISAFLVILAIALLIVLCMKGLNIIPVALLCTVIVSLGVEGGIAEGLYNYFAGGFGGFAGGLFPPFMTGGMFGAMMMATGSDLKLGKVLIDKFGTRFAVYSLGVFVAILAFVNIPSFPFLGAILAFSLMRAADLPRNVACIVMVGTVSAFQFMFPGSPSAGNLVPGGILGTGLFAGASIGVIMCVVQLVIVYLYINFGMIRVYRKKGIGYAPTPMEATLKGQQGEIPEDELPSFLVSILPIIVVVLLCSYLQLAMEMNPYLACVYAQIVGIILIVIFNWSKGVKKKIIPALSNGCIQSCMPLIQTCSVVGFATVVTSSAVYSAVISAVDNMNMNPYVMAVVGTAFLSAIAADPISGITLGASTVGLKAIAAGADAGLIHRLICAASTTFDSMPHSGNLNVTMNFLGLSHKEVYGQVIVVQIGATSAATIVGMIIAMIIG